MADRMNENPYADYDYQTPSLERALEEDKKRGMVEIQRVAQQRSALRCYSPATPSLNYLRSDNGHRWERLGERCRKEFGQQSLPSLPKQLISVPPLKSADGSEASFGFRKPTQISNSPFLHDHSDNEEKFLHSKSDLSSVHRTLTVPVSSRLVESPNSNKKESSGWSAAAADFSRRQSDLFKAKLNLVQNQKSVSNKNLNLPRTTLEKSREWNEPSDSGASRTASTFNIFANKSSEILKSKLGYNQELRIVESQVSESQKKSDFFGSKSTSVSASKPSIPDLTVLLKNLKQIQMLKILEPKGGSTNSEGNDNVSDHLAKCDTRFLQALKKNIGNSPLSNTGVFHSMSDNQNAAVLLLSQFLQKLSSKQENVVDQNKDSDSKRLCIRQKDCFSKNNVPGKSHRKESTSMSVSQKCEVESPLECLSSRSLKRDRSPDCQTVECRKDIESLQKKHHCGSGNGEQVYEASKQKSSRLNNTKGNILGTLKMKTKDLSSEEHSFAKNSSRNLSETNPIRHSLNRSPRRGSHDSSSRWQSGSPERRSSDRSPRRRSRSLKRKSYDRSPDRRSGSPKRRSPNRIPRKNSPGRLSPKRHSCSRNRQSSNRSTEKRSHDKSPQKESCDRSLKGQQGSTNLSHFLDENMKKIKSNKAEKEDRSEEKIVKKDNSKDRFEKRDKTMHEKDGHEYTIITTYGRVQDEIKVPLTSNSGNAIVNLDKELREKVQSVESSVSGTEDAPGKLSVEQKVNKESIVGEAKEGILENCEFYDPGGHWCPNCNMLTPTALDMLWHLKSEAHKECMHPNFKPWFQTNLKKFRNRNEVDINKMNPFKGVHLIMPVEGFYCIICKLTFPDNAVAMDHLLGKEHNMAYKNLAIKPVLFGEKPKSDDRNIVENENEPKPIAVLISQGPDIKRERKEGFPCNQVSNVALTKRKRRALVKIHT